MYQRIKEVRKSTGKTQKVFGESLGVSRETLASYEIGRVTPSKTFLQLLCTTYRVNEKWLLSGDGTMFTETKEDAIDRFASEHGLTFYAKKVLQSYLALDAGGREAVDGWLHSFVELSKEEVGEEINPNVTSILTPTLKIEAEAQAVAKFAHDEYIREKSGASPASSSTGLKQKG
ncbi:MAG: helix-turn-helix domain-containing protein [Defluviitaleaceae bacterium]|nr:helix-turn-helix domain-containing protein [Defluviitaleaceae bacterium]